MTGPVFRSLSCCCCRLSACCVHSGFHLSFFCWSPNRLHHRPHLHPSDKISDPRPMDRGYSRGVPPLNRSSLHSVGQHDACRHPTPAPVSLSRSCSDGSGGAVSCANRVECLHISASDDAMKFSPVSEDDGRGSMLAASTRTESSMPVNQKWVCQW